MEEASYESPARPARVIDSIAESPLYLAKRDGVLLSRLTRNLLLALLLCSTACLSPVFAQAPPANIVVILADDLGYGDVGFQGSPDIPTPNINALALNGVVCSNGYVTHPVCSPSRAAIMTGRYQQRFGHELSPTFDTLIPMNPGLGLPLSEITLPQLLKPAGYVSGAIGKWHLGFAADLFPTERGFDEFFGFLDAEQSYYNTWIWQYGTLVREPAYLTDAFTREGVSFINRHAAQPFFLYLAYNAVHKPYDQPPDVYVQRVSYITDPQRRTYAAMTVALDDGVGQIVAALQANNLLENTLIFFLSDNGAPDKGFTKASNYPLRGYKGDVLEGGVRVPFVVQWVGRLPGNVIYNDLISSLDIVATAAAAAKVALPTDRDYDGLDVVPFLSGERVSRLGRCAGVGSALVPMVHQGLRLPSGRSATGPLNWFWREMQTSCRPRFITWWTISARPRTWPRRNPRT